MTLGILKFTGSLLYGDYVLFKCMYMLEQGCFTFLQLKADRPHPHDYPPTPSDYRYTDKHLRRVNISAVRVHTNGQTDRQTDGRRADGRYQVHYLPRFAVDKKCSTVFSYGQNSDCALIFLTIRIVHLTYHLHSISCMYLSL